MNTLYIIKVGTSFPEIVRQFGDFEDWTLRGLALNGWPISVVNVQQGEFLPDPKQCAGVVVTGSHDMVTDRLSWSVQVEQWIPGILAAGVPFLGICYGHQLLAQAMGGAVDYHALGTEAGTVDVYRFADSADDSLFSEIPLHFTAHTVHSQTVTELPFGAVRLAFNMHEPNHAFRLGENAWGVQFHPEYDEAIMRAYLQACSTELSQEGQMPQDLVQAVRATPAAAALLQRFGRLVAAEVAVN